MILLRNKSDFSTVALVLYNVVNVSLCARVYGCVCVFMRGNDEKRSQLPWNGLVAKRKWIKASSSVWPLIKQVPSINSYPSNAMHCNAIHHGTVLNGMHYALNAHTVKLQSIQFKITFLYFTCSFSRHICSNLIYCIKIQCSTAL